MVLSGTKTSAILSVSFKVYAIPVVVWIKNEPISKRIKNTVINLLNLISKFPK